MILRLFPLFFLLSGFCSLLYQVVWLRLAMAHYGVTAAMTSIVLSVFMAGLAVGSWGAGRLAQRWVGRPHVPLRAYGLAELVIALSIIAVPGLLDWGSTLLAAEGRDVEWGSHSFHAISGIIVSAAMLPFCICMGATIPLAMATIRELSPTDAPRSFSLLYVANVVGAALGTLVSAFVLIELFGFHRSLLVAAGLNGLLGCAALYLSSRGLAATPTAKSAQRPRTDPVKGATLPWALFLTGLSSLAMEVVWVRQYTLFLGNLVYAFAAILATYLVATFVGSQLYRSLAARRSGVLEAPRAWAFLGAASLLPLLAADPRLLEPGVGTAVLRVVIGVGPFSAALGFVTPMLVDRWSGGDPQRAGSIYALNVVGCILGPLAAGFLLLPLLGERGSLLLLAIPFFGLALVFPGSRRSLPVGLAVGAALALFSRDYISIYPHRGVRRDATATVMAVGEGMRSQLLVNGVSMTFLTPLTKVMSHLPLVHLEEPPESALTVCFGMGTSHRSVLAWGIRATSVELVPSVPEMVGLFHPDGPEFMRSPRSRVVIDDGRRFLERTRELYDVIIIDPPPPVQAAGCSLLYSVEFYEAARKRLKPGGILQAWIPRADATVVAAFTGAITDQFPHVRTFMAMEGSGLWGIHLLASDRPIPQRSASELVARMPPAAADDLVEWGPLGDAEALLARVLEGERPLEGFLNAAPGVAPLRDDKPINEYFLLRQLDL